MAYKHEIESLVNEGLSTTQMAERLGFSQTNVRYWLKKYNLKTKPNWNLDNRKKFSDQELLNLWSQCDSVNQFLLRLGVGTSGGAWYHYQKRLTLLGVHFSDSTQSWRSRGGQKTAQIKNRLAIQKRIRLPRPTLKKALDLISREYVCADCKLSEWRGYKLLLHIHHKNEDKTQNQVENLEYLCPNCHSIKHFPL